jgi:hypothetical protein
MCTIASTVLPIILGFCSLNWEGGEGRRGKKSEEKGREGKGGEGKGREEEKAGVFKSTSWPLYPYIS